MKVVGDNSGDLKFDSGLAGESIACGGEQVQNHGGNGERSGGPFGGADELDVSALTAAYGDSVKTEDAHYRVG